MICDIYPPNMDGITPADQRTTFRVGQLFYAVFDLQYATGGTSGKAVFHWCGEVRLHPALALARVTSAAFDLLPKVQGRGVPERYA